MENFHIINGPRKLPSGNYKGLTYETDHMKCSPDGDHVTQNVAQPLRIQEEEVSQSGIFVMEQNPIFVQEFGGLTQLGVVSELDLKPLLQLLVDSFLILFLAQNRVTAWKVGSFWCFFAWAFTCLPQFQG